MFVDVRMRQQILTGAVNKVLLGEGDKLPGGLEVLPFHRTSRTEGPAGATLTLKEGREGGSEGRKQTQQLSIMWVPSIT